MANYHLMEFHQILKEFNTCTQLQYNGKLDIKNNQGKTWSFYYQLGRMVWATGGTHPYRRWLRNMAQNCPYLNINYVHYSAESILIDYWDYLLLENLYATQKIQPAEINSIVENTIIEILFDLAQQKHLSSFSCERNQEFIIKSPLISTSTNMFVKQAQASLHEWVAAGLEDISPSLSPVLQKPEQLQQLVSPLVYKNFERLINGKHTLWDLAAKMNQSLLSITRSLLPYIQQQIVDLIEVSDLPLPTNNINNNHQIAQSKKGRYPLIACIDDSLQVCKMLEGIITANGMRFMSIQNPVDALPMLIENKPDLIFLDLVMPVINGYELCNQLRRSSVFTQTPVVILTGSDGVFDRVRSKVFGATEFITKPVKTDQVIGMVDKYLQPEQKVEKLSNLVVSY
ncbi:response regulator [Sphaerospermopsis aphanizomenoides BCCUSP55]|uniref:response regulator n=1 Tax=Sphaerospermopsis aphanizomenoides TaxID=459663 RepID=UPI0019046BD2|nr:response regulator [Sphaerospermopsis aphanizomenoides]MBK1986220.1 response regulator [Sphaerospermopsis aphanizomenoides BCCUSP55]